MDQAPATIDRDVVEQPLQRPLPAPCEAFVDFPNLFGNMDMNGTIPTELQNGRQLFWRDRPQRVRCEPDHRALLPRHGAAARLQQPRKAVDAIDETLLAPIGCAITEAGMGVEDRQQCQADAAGLRRSRDALGQFANVGIGRARHVVMDIMKFAHPGEARFQHLDIGLGCHRLDIIGGHAADKAVHEIAPCPETIGGGAPDFGQPGHAALKSMAVQIGHAGKSDAVALIAGLRGNARLDADEPAPIERHPDLAGPALRQQSLFKE